MIRSMNVSILGMGIIGSAWANNLEHDGLLHARWNRTPKPMARFAPHAADAVKEADLIIVVVADPPAVDSVLTQIEPVLRPGQIVAQSSTISAAWTLQFAERVHKTGARFLEAPFTGSKPSAEARKTVFYLGGDRELMESATPALNHLGSVLPIGPLGSASSLKLAMNMNIAMVMESLAESVRFAREQGIPDAIYFDALRLNSSRSGVADMKEAKLKAGDFSPQFSIKHMDKDLRLALESAGPLALPQLTQVKSRFEECIRRGYGEDDYSAIIRLL
jgi:3-hydroxyisobutyrate dehydrogenase-like beta-hydroxyacid dehydrogenase